MEQMRSPSVFWLTMVNFLTLRLLPTSRRNLAPLDLPLPHNFSEGGGQGSAALTPSIPITQSVEEHTTRFRDIFSDTVFEDNTRFLAVCPSRQECHTAEFSYNNIRFGNFYKENSKPNMMTTVIK